MHWHPMIDELSPYTLACEQAQLFLPPFKSSAINNQLNTSLADNVKTSLVERARQEALTDDEPIHRIDDTEVCI